MSNKEALTDCVRKFEKKQGSNNSTKIYNVLAVFEVKVKNDQRSKFSNLSNWKEEA